MSKASKVAIICSAIVIVIVLVTVLLFSYNTDLFVNKNRKELTLQLNDRSITIPLEHKYSFYTPTVRVLKTEKTINEIICMFTENINDKKDKIVVKMIDQIAFLYLYTDNVFAQSIFIEPYGAKKDELRVGVNEFVPLCLFGSVEHFNELFQDKDKLVDGGIYNLQEKHYPNSLQMLREYLSHIYDIKNYDVGSISLVVENKNIKLKDISS
ncbi:MAG: hypothetical protein RSB10_00375 [Clostridia bacterium]